MSLTSIKCPLCLSDSVSLKLVKSSGERYQDCKNCGLIFLEKEYYLSPEEEKAHYQTHNNDIHDSGYQKFVSPIVNYVSQEIPLNHRGLDYGSGTGPVITYLLKEKGYEMHLYDPFFANNLSALERDYDFIVSCEVVEHFHDPAKEFTKLTSLLKNNGTLVIMTDFYDDSMDFTNWYYHRDPTHVCFYREKTFEWIRDFFRFKELIKTDRRAIVLKS